MGRTKKITGLGDVIATVTEAVGIQPCDGCNERKLKLNKLFPIGTKELSDEQYKYLTDFFAADYKEINTEQQIKLMDIYCYAYNYQAFEPCVNCSGVWKSILNKLNKLII
jgi:predicted NodU family carbamoyl transferase